MEFTREQKRNIYIRAKELIQDGGWVQGAFAVNSSGSMVNPTEPSAVAWSLAGAVMKACYELGENLRYYDSGIMTLQDANDKLYTIFDAINILENIHDNGF